MINFQKIEGKSFANNGYNHYIENTLNVDGWISENLGESTSVGMDIYGLHRGLSSGKPIIFIQSSIHGTEWLGTFWARMFVEYLSNPHLAPPQVRQHFKMLDNTFAFYWVPIANPYGFENNIYENENAINANTDYGDNQTQNESIIMKSKITELQPVAIIDNHSWTHDSTPCHRLYCKNSRVISSYNDRFSVLGDNVLKTTELVTRERVNKYQYGAPNNHLHDWSTTLVSRDGINTMTFLIETDLKETSEVQTAQGVNAMLSFSLYFYNWYKLRIQNPST